MDGEKFIECNSKTLEIFGFKTNEDIFDRKPWDFSPKFPKKPETFGDFYFLAAQRSAGGLLGVLLSGSQVNEKY